MGEWSFLSSLLDAVQEHSPLVGRFWLVVMLIFRILILATVGSDMFEDEQEEFVCNTLQPGCRQVCYDRAFPISHYRFWVFHIVLLSAPAVLFVIYSMHQSAKMGRDVEEEEASRDGRQVNTRPKLRPDQRGRHIRIFYLVNVIIRILAEIGFLVGQWLLYGFKVDPEYQCQREPCKHTVDCFVSRPTEKTIFLQFYFVVGVISTLLSLSELLHILIKGKCVRNERSHHPPPAYERDNWSNREHERTSHFLLQGQAKNGREVTVTDGHQLSISYPPGANYNVKVAPSSANSSKSSRILANGDLTV
ncbi:gap junction delta-3 protein isoform 1-T2 [Discoglossus pictus]